jgi:hypothetical protein
MNSRLFSRRKRINLSGPKLVHHLDITHHIVTDSLLKYDKYRK